MVYSLIVILNIIFDNNQKNVLLQEFSSILSHKLVCSIMYWHLYNKRANILVPTAPSTSCIYLP
uniref:Uncharacterized protein n=1 Tax=Arion vulgaris TaxID=1028688 RepID=A0A0B6ZV61_9EUPU